jgi:hypothetical protein
MYHLQSHFEPCRIFLLKRNLDNRSHPTLGANKGFLFERMKTIIESMVKGMLSIKVQ